ncbi:hypothetical protein BpHYR1_017532 [Brachionus plicatilis]|uniref:Uncharacterized protein n=1 Tax=Brachionus plicatilis TaxID=10195 RepID=A0A3M7PZN3_BRAPC|nr:hypothetical protein BpHYR1_017532 [Brachionus plicatilis]
MGTFLIFTLLKKYERELHIITLNCIMLSYIFLHTRNDLTFSDIETKNDLNRKSSRQYNLLKNFKIILFLKMILTHLQKFLLL